MDVMASVNNEIQLVLRECCKIETYCVYWRQQVTYKNRIAQVCTCIRTGATNSFPPGQNGPNFVDDIFKSTFSNEIGWI